MSWHPTEARRQARAEATAAGCTCHPDVKSTPDRRVIVTHDDDCTLLRAGTIAAHLGDLERLQAQLAGESKTIWLPHGTPNLVHVEVRRRFPKAKVTESRWVGEGQMILGEATDLFGDIRPLPPEFGAAR